MMRRRSEIIALLVIVFIIIALSALSYKEDSDASNAAPSTAIRSSYRSFPGGYKALYLTFRNLGFPVRRQLHPFGTDTLPSEGLLIIADPYKNKISAYESRCFLDWIRRGNHALVLTEHHRETITALMGTPAPDEVEPPILPPGMSYGHLSQSLPTATTAAPVFPSTFTRDAEQLRVKSGYRFTNDSLRANIIKTTGGIVPLYRDTQGVVLAYSNLGRGGIFWCSSPWSFSNEGIGEGRNFDFIYGVASLQPNAPVIFDEYHHGYGAGMSVWTITPLVGKLGIGQLVLALLLLLLALSWRFGTPRLPAEERITHSRAEYLTSMAGLLERAKTTHMLRDQLQLLLFRRLGHRLGLPPRAAPERFVAMNAERKVVDQHLLQRIVERLQQMARETRPDAFALLRLAGDIHRLLHQRPR